MNEDEELNEELTEFVERLEGLCRQYNVKIECFCDNVVGTPHAVASIRGTDDDYRNIDMDLDNGYEFGDPISYK
jgi:hypothetical protein